MTEKINAAEDAFLNNKDKRANAALLCTLLDLYGLEWRTSNNVHFRVKRADQEAWQAIDVWPSTLRVGTSINDESHFNLDVRRRVIVKFFKGMAA